MAHDRSFPLATPPAALLPQHGQLALGGGGTTSFGLAWAARRYRSLWTSVIVHGVGGFFIVLVLAVILGWYP